MSLEAQRKYVKANREKVRAANRASYHKHKNERQKVYKAYWEIH